MKSDRIHVKLGHFELIVGEGYNVTKCRPETLVILESIVMMVIFQVRQILEYCHFTGTAHSRESLPMKLRDI